jgi:hypothetical protein
MEPWMESTGEQKEPERREPARNYEPRVERGWMDIARPDLRAWQFEPRTSFAITLFTASVVVFFLLFTLVLFPVLLLMNQ